MRKSVPVEDRELNHSPLNSTDVAKQWGSIYTGKCVPVEDVLAVHVLLKLLQGVEQVVRVDGVVVVASEASIVSGICVHVHLLACKTHANLVASNPSMHAEAFWSSLPATRTHSSNCYITRTFSPRCFRFPLLQHARTQTLNFRRPRCFFFFFAWKQSHATVFQFFNSLYASQIVQEGRRFRSSSNMEADLPVDLACVWKLQRELCEWGPNNTALLSAAPPERTSVAYCLVFRDPDKYV